MRWCFSLWFLWILAFDEKSHRVFWHSDNKHLKSTPDYIDQAHKSIGTVKQIHALKPTMTDTPRPSKTNLKNQEARMPSATPKDQPSSRKNQRKGENPVQISPSNNLSADYGYPSLCICRNSACRAIMSMEDTFCKRCSCCICKRFDDNKDPSLWLVCASESDSEESCGLSSHIECAFQRGKVGVVGFGQSMILDGSYCCPSCGYVSLILGCWKKQLCIAKDARRVDVMCNRIFWSYRLLEGTARFQELHNIVKDAKEKLESEVGPVNGVSATMARCIVSRLPIAGEVQKLCALAIEKANEWLAAESILNLHHREGPLPPACSTKSPEIIEDGPSSDVEALKGQLHPSREIDLNVVSIPDLNVEISPALGSVGEDSKHLVGSAIKADDDAESHDSKRISTNGEVPAVNHQAEIPQKKAVASNEERPENSGLTNVSPSGIAKMPGNSAAKFEDCIKTIRQLECQGHMEREFRMKFLTWFSLRSTEQQKRVVYAFIETLNDDPSSLAAQLSDSFSDIVSYKRPRTGFCSKLWHELL